MEEKETKRIFYSKGMKIFHVILFLISVGAFMIFGSLMMGLLSNGMDLSNAKNNQEIFYENTTQCGNEVVQFLYNEKEQIRRIEQYMTGGKLDLKKTIDITDTYSYEKEKNKNTTYTIGNLVKISESESYQALENIMQNAWYGSFDLDFAQQEADKLIKEKARDEKRVDRFIERKETILNSGWFSDEFIYLYLNSLKMEELLPESGVSLADYAMENPSHVSLMDLYNDLQSAVKYISQLKGFHAHQGNLLYFIQNTETKDCYTNVSEWEDGYSKAVEKDIPKMLYVTVERADGKVKTAYMENETPAERIILDYIQQREIIGDNERITLLLNVNYPMQDTFSEKSEFYKKYHQWGKTSVVGSVISFLVGVLMFGLLTMQTGRNSKDGKLQLWRSDRIATELIFGISVLAFGFMAFVGILAISAASSGEEMFVIGMLTSGQVVLAGIFLWSYLGLVRRIKGKIFWSNSLTSTIMKSCKKVYLARKTSSRMIIAFAILMLLNILLILGFGGGGAIIVLLGGIVILLYLIRENAGRQVIQDGLGRIASGELEFKINETELTGSNREMAEAVNHVGDGLMAAVKETVKHERLKADLITNVSHDIKTPLTSIINYVDLLKRENIQDEKLKGYIDVLDKKSQRLKQLTEDLVEASKISSGNVVLDMHPIGLGDLVWQTNAEFEEKFSNKNLQIVCEIPEHPVYIMADGRRMWRVVENLYNNVAKYAMPNTRVYVSVQELGCRVAFEVKNISENPLNINADELTERFIRGDVSRNTEGSGLGLSIAQNLVKLQGGTFDIYLDGDLFKITMTFEKVKR